jgi:hypothetical protein
MEPMSQEGMQEFMRGRGVAGRAAVGDHHGVLQLLYEKLALAIDQTADARTKQSLSKEIREIQKDLLKLECPNTEQPVEPEKVSPLHVVKSKQAAGIPGTKDRARAKAS